MWDIIQRLPESLTLVVVSHSLDEIEALCNRFGILVHGNMKFIGSIEDLMEKYGAGYIIEVNAEPRMLDSVHTFCLERAITRNALGNNHLIQILTLERDQEIGLLRLRVEEEFDIPFALGEFEKKKSSLKISDYSISRVSLQHILDMSILSESLSPIHVRR